MISVIVHLTKTIKHCVYEEDYNWNPSISTCDCGKDCDTSEYLQNCTCMKSLADDLVVTRNEIVDTPETTSISPSDKINCWLISVVLLAIVCLLLLEVIVVMYCWR